MAIAFVSSSNAANQTGSTFPVDKPAGAANGDWLIAAQETQLNAGTAPAAPSGWSLLDRQAFGSMADYDLVIWIREVSGDGSSYTFNNAGGFPLSPISNVLISCYSGAAEPTQITKNSGQGDTLTATGLTTAEDNSYLLAAFGISAGSASITTPTSMTNIDQIGDGSGGKVKGAYVSQPSAGASGNKDALNGAFNNRYWAALLVAIPPAAASAFSSTGTLMGI